MDDEPARLVTQRVIHVTLCDALCDTAFDGRYALYLPACTSKRPRNAVSYWRSI
jgi:hypothetical protein